MSGEPPVGGPVQCAVIGSPIAHSLSPVLHRAAYAWLGLDWSYTRHEVTPATLDAFLARCRGTWRGLSCTMPLKSAIVGLGATDATVDALGVANTVLFDGAVTDRAARRVRNTDVTGLRRAIESVTSPRHAGVAAASPPIGGPAGADTPVAALPSSPTGVAPERPSASWLAWSSIGGPVRVAVPVGAASPSPTGGAPERSSASSPAWLRTALVVGTGATATSAVYALAGLGLARVDVAGRNEGALAALAERAAAWGVAVVGHGLDEPWPAVDLAVSTVPTDIGAGLAPSLLGAAGVIFDVLYNPWPTPLLARAAVAGRPTVSGRDLLIHQAVGQIELMTGRTVPVEVLRVALGG